MLMPDNSEHFYYQGVRVYKYQAFMNSQLNIVELITTEDGQHHVISTPWEDLNDIEKYVVEQRGLDVEKERERWRE